MNFLRDLTPLRRVCGAAVAALLLGLAFTAPASAQAQIDPRRSLLGGVVGAMTRAAGAGQPAERPFTQGTSYQVCFTPGMDCEGLIAGEIGRARQQILVQVYSFTSKVIAEALVKAKRSGVAVYAVLDKSQRTERYSGATFLANAGIPVVIDEIPAIAHNKVIVIDGVDVVTGSFNFTTSAQERNAENVIIIHNDPAVAKAYADNWLSRQKVSVPFQR
jgi:phosphatidylserine/phosphatidylglycerophosphate/cardiolipin synthase-like enzyme